MGAIRGRRAGSGRPRFGWSVVAGLGRGAVRPTFARRDPIDERAAADMLAQGSALADRFQSLPKPALTADEILDARREIRGELVRFGGSATANSDRLRHVAAAKSRQAFAISVVMRLQPVPHGGAIFGFV